MGSYNMVLTILNRSYEKDYVDFFKQNGIVHMTQMLGHGTASKSILDYLGIEKNEKIVMETVVAAGKVNSLFSGLVSRMGINLPGTGVAMSIPVESIAGSSSMKYLTEGQEVQAAEEVKMKESAYSLITVIAEKGCSDMVMDAAREAGAKGGTVVHAKGTGKESETKFFGMSISPEKEMIYIATRKSEKGDIMRAIMEKAGPHTDAGAVVFSLPVEDIVGLTTLMEEEKEGQ
ncbi:MAG: P-II family nitrogen regulator [Lachnospiraceae bacterium]|nr:P-II family nitrogen regulator [Lachnospiraceae bacterium]